MKTGKDIDAFLERIGKRLNESPRASHSGKHRAAFTALRPVIEATLAQGYTMMATWDSLREEKKLSMSYETFRTHCRRAGIGQAVRTAAPASAPASGAAAAGRCSGGSTRHCWPRRMRCNGDSATSACHARRTSMGERGSALTARFTRAAVAAGQRWSVDSAP